MWDNPILVGALTAISGVAIAWAVSWFNARKAVAEAVKAKTEAASKEEMMLAELRALKIQADIAEQKRANTLRLAEDTTQKLADMSAKQDALVLTVDHSASKRESIEQDLRAKLEASTVALQTQKDLALAELKHRDAKIDDLQRQLTTLALSLPPPAPATPAADSKAAVADTAPRLVQP